MDHIEGELKEIERGNLGNTEGEDVDQSDHIGEVHYLRTEMEKILGSDAFQSEEGKSRIQNLLDGNTQMGIQKNIDQMI